MEILFAVVILAPLVLFFLLTLAVTVHFIWLSHRGRWPPGTYDVQAPGGAGGRAGRVVRRSPGPRSSYAVHSGGRGSGS